MEKTKRTSAIIRLLILASLIVGVPVFLYFNCRETLFNTEWLRGLPQLLMHYKGYAAAILIGLQILQVIVCIIPGQPIQFAGSYLFGITGGYLISIIGAVIGASITFYLSRVLGYDAVTILFDKDKIEDYCGIIQDQIQTFSAGIFCRPLAGHAREHPDGILFQPEKLLRDRSAGNSDRHYAGRLLYQAKGHDSASG